MRPSDPGCRRPEVRLGAAWRAERGHRSGGARVNRPRCFVRRVCDAARTKAQAWQRCGRDRWGVRFADRFGDGFADRFGDGFGRLRRSPSEVSQRERAVGSQESAATVAGLFRGQGQGGSGVWACSSPSFHCASASATQGASGDEVAARPALDGVGACVHPGAAPHPAAR